LEGECQDEMPRALSRSDLKSVDEEAWRNVSQLFDTQHGLVLFSE
jgi:hypothetical protein